MEKTPMTWNQRASLWLRMLVRVSLTAAVFVLIRGTGAWLLELTMPFLLGWGTAILLDPLIGRLVEWFGVSRRFVCLLLIFSLVLTVGGGGGVLLYSGGKEIMDLIQNWSTLFDTFQSALENMEVLFIRLFSLIPPALSATGEAVLIRLLDWMENSIPRVLGELGGQTKDSLMRLPSFIFALFVFLLDTYFISADYPALCHKLSKRMSGRMVRRLCRVRATVLAAFGGYLKAQLLLSVGVFCILLLGFLIVGQPYSLLLAFGLAVLDFIPLLGAGTAMIPWAVFSLLTHGYSTAISIALIWGAVALYRRFAEPKVLGDKTGLSPIMSLFSIYAGMKLGGVLGMILSPILVLVALNLLKSGMFDGVLWDLRLAWMDISGLLAGDRK